VNTISTNDGPALGTGLLYSFDDGVDFTLEPGSIPGISCTYSPVSDASVWSYCSGGHFMFVYLSNDAGTSFMALDPAGTDDDYGPNGYPNGSTLEAASLTTAVAASDLPGSSLIRTVDGGATWNVVQAPLDNSGTWSVIGFTTPEVGYAFWQSGGEDSPTSTSQLWHTTNGGATWSSIAGLS
jgi:hypothetical protein